MTPETAPAPSGAPGACDTVPAFLARARRILAGDVRSEDYLAVPDEVEVEVAAFLQRFAEEHGVGPSAEGAQHVRNAWTLQYHHGGEEVLCRTTDFGVIVLAAGVRDIGVVRRELGPDSRCGFALTFPESV